MDQKNEARETASPRASRRTLNVAEYTRLAEAIAAECTDYGMVHKWAGRNKVQPHRAKMAWHIGRLAEPLRKLLVTEGSPLSVSAGSVIGMFHPDAQWYLYNLLIGKVRLPKKAHRLTQEALLRISRDRGTVQERFLAYNYPWPECLDSGGRLKPGASPWKLE